MKILVAHAGSYDYETELYEPLKNSELSKVHTFVFPHDPENKNIPTSEQLKDADCFIAEVSYPSTGAGIEIGMAYAAKVPLLFVYKKGSSPSSSLHFVSQDILEYEDEADLVSKVREYVKKISEMSNHE